MADLGKLQKIVEQALQPRAFLLHCPDPLNRTPLSRRLFPRRGLRRAVGGSDGSWREGF